MLKVKCLKLYLEKVTGLANLNQTYTSVMLFSLVNLNKLVTHIAFFFTHLIPKQPNK